MIKVLVKIVCIFHGIACFLPTTLANFNIYLLKEEVSTLLGLEAELYYVREGVVNEYASKWIVKVPPIVHSLNFSWQALSRRQVLYNMAVSVSDTGESNHILLPPSVNVSLSGTIPQDVASFKLDLPCTGKVSGEVEVILNINVTSSRPSLPPIVLNLIRKKICLKGVPAQTFLAHKDVKDKETKHLPVVAWVLCGILSFCLVSGTILGLVWWRRKLLVRKRTCSFASSLQPVFIASNQKNMNAASATGNTILKYSFIQNSYTTPSGTLQSNYEPNMYASVYKFPFQSTDFTGSLPVCNHTTSSYSGIYESSCNSDSNGSGDKYEANTNNKNVNDKDATSSCCSECRAIYAKYSQPHGFQEEFQRLHMDRERVRLTEIIQEGRIGKVYKGWVQREHPELDQQVVIKTIREGVAEDEMRSFFFECSLLSGLRHQNLLTLVGVSLCENAPPFFIYPDIHGRNLKCYLKHLVLPLKMTDLVKICLQALKGITFIHNSGFVHKDIAVRNCIINDNLNVRVTDSALAKDFFPDDYEVEKGITQPLRWMAPEVIVQFSSVSEASDMWSFGVLIWELVTQGERPYAEFAGHRIGTLLHEGMKLPQPLTCPDELHCLMKSCWDLNPAARPKDQNVIEYLNSFKSSLNSFV